jgi:hypothetical protein
MAAGWPTKVTYADGEVFSASDINSTNGTINYINPTAATDNQVLTRDNVASGKVKWANSPANTLTTTGDLYYASAANTPARLGIGSTNQVLTVAGGVPTWAAGSSTFTKIGSTVTFSNVASQAFDSVFTATYKSYWINIETLYGATSSSAVYLQLRYAGPTTLTTRYYANSFAMPYTGANASTQTSNGSQATIAAKIGGASPNMSGGNFYIYGVGISSDVTASGTYANSGDSVGYAFNVNISGATTRAYTGFLLSASAGNIYGSVSVYGVS